MDKEVYRVIGLFSVVILGIIIAYEYRIRKFSRHFGQVLDKIIAGDQVEFRITKETLEGKLNFKLKRLSEITESKATQAEKEKEAFKSLLGDISHQVKTPIANIKMYNNILIERDVNKIQQEEFLRLNNRQIEKLDFLMQSMLKMSRLETGVIQLQEGRHKIINVVANVLSQMSCQLEQKSIDIRVECDENICATFDPKWTEEALFNVLDNAVKYTHEQGEIQVTVESLEIYTAINIEDNGIGITEAEQPLIFKRFYRSPGVHKVEGVGIGLALTREIISRQQGFIKVISTPEKGSRFSLFLPTENLSKL